MKVQSPRVTRSSWDRDREYLAADASREACLTVSSKRKYATIHFDTATTWPRLGDPSGKWPRFRLPEHVMDQLKQLYIEYCGSHWEQMRKHDRFFFFGPEIGDFPVLKEDGLDFAEKIATLLRNYDDTPE